MKPSKLQPALLGGLFIGVLSALPFVNVLNCCCLWLVTGGLLAAYVMQQNHSAPVSLGDGAVAGLLAGLIGFVVMLVASIPIEMLAAPYTRGLSQGMFGRPNTVNPEVRDMLQSVPPALLAAVGGALFLFVGSLASTIGGVIGAALFRRSVPPAPPDAGPPPSMPDGWGPPPGGPPDPAPLPSSLSHSSRIEGAAVAGAAVAGAAVEGAAVEGAAVEGSAVEGSAVEGAAVDEHVTPGPGSSEPSS